MADSYRYGWVFLLMLTACGGGSSPGGGGSDATGSSGSPNGGITQAEPAPLPAMCSPAGAGSPANIIGPLASDVPGSESKNYPWVATEVDLAAAGYVEEEYFFCGTSIAQPGTYTTRMIVRRPVNPADASGVVFAEWLNVTSLADLEIVWAHSFEHIMREGHTYVGISAQRGGHYPAPRGLLHFSPDRYG